MELFFALIIAASVSAAATPLVQTIARKYGVLDMPGGSRKVHRKPVPLMGGVAVFLGIFAAIAAAYAFGWLPGEHIKAKYLVGIAAAILLIIFGGVLDDKFDLRPRKQIIWPLLACLVVIVSGIGISYITNPFGGLLYLDKYVATVLWWEGLPYKLTILADIFTVGWLMTMSYTTKLLDGLDGLVSGMVVIGGLVIAAVSLMGEVAQPDTAILAMIVAGAFLGFLFFNFHPAKIFLGEGGSLMAGFLLGVLAIISGGKIATTLLILGLPLFDAIYVVLRRLIRERRSPVSADRLHLHFRLLDMGFSHRQSVLIFYFVATLFGTLTLFLRGWEKVVALGLVVSLLIFLVAAGSVYLKGKSRGSGGKVTEDA